MEPLHPPGESPEATGQTRPAPIVSRPPMSRSVHDSLRRRIAVLHWRAGRLSPQLRGMLWSGLAGLQFVALNALMRDLTIKLGPFQTQFLRYLAGAILLLPLVLRTGAAHWRPVSVPGQFARGTVHTVGLVMWFIAVPHVPLADITAINFTGPLFIMLGASLFLGEPMRWARWVASALGLAGVLMVVGPQLRGSGGVPLLVLLASSPVFAASYLMTKALSGRERPEVIVAWQTLTVSCLSLPLVFAQAWRWPTLGQWALLFLCGLIGSAGHYCLTRSYKVADISATQSIKFLDLIWASLLGWALFGDLPTGWTLVGGGVIAASTVWLVRRESRAASSR